MKSLSGISTTKCAFQIRSIKKGTNTCSATHRKSKIAKEVTAFRITT